jgi:hypothetical protein
MNSSEFRKKRKLLGLCVCCVNPAEIGRTMCLSCSEKHKICAYKKIEEYVAQGKCRCGRDKESNLYRCDKCTESDRLSKIKVRKNRKNNNCCTRCGKPLLERSEVTKCINCAEGCLEFNW